MWLQYSFALYLKATWNLSWEVVLYFLICPKTDSNELIWSLKTSQCKNRIWNIRCWGKKNIRYEIVINEAPNLELKNSEPFILVICPISHNLGCWSLEVYEYKIHSSWKPKLTQLWKHLTWMISKKMKKKGT